MKRFFKILFVLVIVFEMGFLVNQYGVHLELMERIRAETERMQQSLSSYREERLIKHVEKMGQSTYIPSGVSFLTKRVYVQDLGYRPPNGAPIFYVPFPSTLCMMGEGRGHSTRIMYEAHVGACKKLMEGI